MYLTCAGEGELVFGLTGHSVTLAKASPGAKDFFAVVFARSGGIAGRVWARAAVRRGQWVLREIGCDQDHVHITIDAGTDGPKDIAKALKGTSGRKILSEFPHIKKTYFWGSGFWSPTIYFDSLGEKTITDMDTYTRNQGQSRNLKSKLGQQHLDDFAS